MVRILDLTMKTTVDWRRTLPWLDEKLHLLLEHPSKDAELEQW